MKVLNLSKIIKKIFYYNLINMMKKVNKMKSKKIKNLKFSKIAILKKYILKASQFSQSPIIKAR